MEERRKKIEQKEYGRFGKVQIVVVVALLLIAVLSASVVTNYTTAPENHAKSIAALDEKKKTVLELTAASTGISAAITALPGDTGSPIAEKLVDLSSYFLIVLCAIYIEKYLLTITGYVAFRFLIPLACILLAIWIFYKKDILMRLATKILLFGVAVYLVVPTSVKISNMIENTYESSIESTIQSAKDSMEEIEKNTDSADSTKSEKESGIISGVISKVKDGVTGITDKVGTIINDFIESLAVLIVTSCVIPILVLLLFVWLIKIIFGINIDTSKMRIGRKTV